MKHKAITNTMHFYNHVFVEINIIHQLIIQRNQTFK